MREKGKGTPDEGRRTRREWHNIIAKNGTCIISCNVSNSCMARSDYSYFYRKENRESKGKSNLTRFAVPVRFGGGIKTCLFFNLKPMYFYPTSYITGFNDKMNDFYLYVLCSRHCYKHFKYIHS